MCCDMNHILQLVVLSWGSASLYVSIVWKACLSCHCYLLFSVTIALMVHFTF